MLISKTFVRIRVILDTNVVVDYGDSFIDRVVNGHFFLIIPRVVLTELDGLKKKFIAEPEKLKVVPCAIKKIRDLCTEKNCSYHLQLLLIILLINITIHSCIQQS